MKYDLDPTPLWDWMNERHAIYMRRARGKPPPWTEDKILNTYKFTNVYREYDRVTQELHNRVDRMEPNARKLFSIIVFRAFNWPQTYDLLVKGRALKKDHWDGDLAKELLHDAKMRGEKVFTGAYIVTNGGSTRPKIDVMCDALSEIFSCKGRLWTDMMAVGTMEGATKLLATYPMHGMFTSYEVVCDLRHQEDMLDLAPDKLTWANLGPGAKRGIERLVGGGRRKRGAFKTRQEYIDVMAELCRMAPKELDKRTFGAAPPIECREIEHSLCETDKYLRVKLGEGKPRSKYDHAPR